MSELPRFIVDGLLTGPGEYRLPPEEARHALRSLRLHNGDPLVVFDGAGNYANAIIASEDPGDLRVQVAEVKEELRRPVSISIATGIPKGKRWQILVEKCTELGVDRLYPTLTSRSVVRGEGDPGHWRRWAVEAAKQCRRASLPEILPPRELTPILAEAKEENFMLFLADPEGESPRSYQKEIMVAGRVLVFIGPEGGYSEEEIAFCLTNGVKKICLAPYVLRVETAAAAACTLIHDL
ncbi:MAG: 16S rRNA (uracil(1498)-N(3))-methyltransferase [Planctomycetota bacterium]|jgi:16S rRNA (uracil1498-N3)-methyltransferase|nr:16S rRNA (uracil(1498)-N(3))-methyltransferase [Planctomycetota bacterium]